MLFSSRFMFGFRVWMIFGCGRLICCLLLGVLLRLRVKVCLCCNCMVLVVKWLICSFGFCRFMSMLIG